MDLVGVAVIVQACILEEWGSKFGWNTVYQGQCSG
jgi:hypothetical protein